MTRILFLAGLLALACTSCTTARKTYPGPRASTGYGARGYEDPFSGWRVTRSSASTRVRFDD